MTDPLRTTRLWLLVSLLVGGCSATPTPRYYQLAATLPTSSSATSSPVPSRSSPQPALGVGPIQVAQFLQRPQILTSEGHRQLTLAEFDRWAEPLDSATQRALIQNLSRLSGQPVVAFPWRQREQPTLGLQLTLHELDRYEGQAHLTAYWHLHHPAEQRLIRRGESRLSRPLPDHRYETLAEAYSLLLAELSRQLYEVIRNAEQSLPASTKVE